VVTPLGNRTAIARLLLLDHGITAAKFLRMESNSKSRLAGFLPRLEAEVYRGRAVVFWTHTVEQRKTGWLNAEFHSAFRESALHAAVRENLFCPIYVLMPDHFHLIWMGIASGSDQRLATRFLRRCLASQLKPLRWQHQPHDHVLRVEERMKEAFLATVHYIAENPVRTGLTDRGLGWPYTGCMVPGYPDLHPRQTDFWSKFWRLYDAAALRGTIGKTPLEPAV